MSLESQPHETSNLCTTRSRPLAMLAMHTPPAPPVPEFHPMKASYHLNGPMPSPPSWAIHYNQSQENASRNGSYFMQFKTPLVFGSPE